MLLKKFGDIMHKTRLAFKTACTFSVVLWSLFMSIRWPKWVMLDWKNMHLSLFSLKLFVQSISKTCINLCSVSSGVEPCTMISSKKHCTPSVLWRIWSMNLCHSEGAIFIPNIKWFTLYCFLCVLSVCKRELLSSMAMCK